MKTELYTIVGSKIQEIRKEKGISQMELAEILGLSRTSISNIENGRHPIFLHHIYTMAENFNIPLETILPPVSNVQNENNIIEDLKETLLLKGITDERTLLSVFSVINRNKS